jgi:hypothetical protein
MNKIWVGLRSNGRPQLISVLTSLYNNVDMIEGITIVGELDSASKSILCDFSIPINYILGQYNLGQATRKLIEDVRKVKSDLILFIDDDVLFKRQHLVDLLMKKAEGFEVVSVMQRGPYISGPFESIWLETGEIEFYLSLWNKVVLKNFNDNDLDLLEKCIYGGEFFVLTWLLKRDFRKIVLGCEKDRPFHIFVEGKGSDWRKATLEEWEDLGKEIRCAKVPSKIELALRKWGNKIEGRKNAT